MLDYAFIDSQNYSQNTQIKKDLVWIMYIYMQKTNYIIETLMWFFKIINTIWDTHYLGKSSRMKNPLYMTKCGTIALHISH